MRKKLHSFVLWLGSAIIFVLAVPAAALLAMIYGVSSLVDRTVGREPAA